MTPGDLLRWWWPVASWAIVVAALVAACLAALPARVRGRLRWLPIVAAATTAVPVGGLPLGRWLYGFAPPPSVPLLAVLLDVVVATLRDRRLFDAAARRAAVWFGAAAGLALYPAALGLGGFDPYGLGWRPLGIATATAGLAAGLLLLGNRFGLALVASALAWQAGCLESDNAWDYLVDPVYAILAVLNLATCGLGWLRYRGPVAGHAAAVLLGAALLACANVGRAADDVVPRSTLDERFAEAIGRIERRARDAGATAVADLVRDWPRPDAGGVQFVPSVPPRIVAPPEVDSPQLEEVWTDFLRARRDRAEGLFALARTAAKAHAAVPTRAERSRPVDPDAPPLAQRSCAVVGLLFDVLRDDPDHERARRALGWIRRGDEWVWPEAGRRAERKEEFDPAFGWLPRGRLERYRSGERFDRGAWIVAAEDDARDRTVDRGRRFTSDHWEIVSTADMATTAGLAATLEDARLVWLCIFGAARQEPAALEKSLTAGGRPRPQEPFAATLCGSRGQYVEELERVEPSIARTEGIYWAPTKTAWFFAGPATGPDGEEVAGPAAFTVHHEATHQLFAESRATSPLAGEACGFWAIEAAALYMESLRQTGDGWLVGGLDAGRVPAARERLLTDEFHVPLEELTTLGRADFQTRPRLADLYDEIAGLADFLMNGRGGRYREAFVEYLARVYSGTADPETLARLCRTSYADLDAEYRRHLSP